jgi:hypothetical protein
MCKLCDGNDNERIEMGKIFGYPDCCINEFIRDGKIMKRKKKDVRNDAQIAVAIETGGFVPCKMHAEMIVSGRITVDELVVERRDIKKAKKLNKIAHKY